MLALLYLGLAICVGERLCGRFFRFVSTAHRWATGALVGLVLSTGFTYLAARHFASATTPLLLGDIVFFAAAAIFLITCPPRREPLPMHPRGSGSQKWDWITLALYTVLACWMMFAVLGWKNGNIFIGVTQWSDYGPNTAIVQSFAVGHNFPAEYPHFAGEPIRYHFLFYFQAGNLEFLGLNPVWSINLLSVLTLICMLALVIALGQLLFKSRAVGILASALFFCHGTLNLVAFLRAQTSLKGAWWAIYTLREYLTSGYPYRGENWGIWTQVVFVNQRHLASAIGLFLVVLIFLFDRYLEKAEQRKLARAAAKRAEPIEPKEEGEPPGASELPIRAGDVARPTEDVAAAETETYLEPQPAGHPSSAPGIASESEAPPSDTIEGLELSPSPKVASVSEAPPSATIESLEPSSPPEVTSLGEAPQPDTPAPLEESKPTANYASAGEAKTPETIASGEEARPEPAATLGGEATKPEAVESREEAPSADEPKTFASRAYEEYMRRGREAASAGETEGSETVETAKESSPQDAENVPASQTEPAISLASATQSSPEPDTPSVSEAPSTPSPVCEPAPAVSRAMIPQLIHDNLVSGRGFIFCGLLLGALPYWNAPVFTAAFAVLGLLFVLFPCRRFMVGLAITTALVGLPQVLALRSGNARTGASLIHWGYTLGNVPVMQVVKYLGFTFGIKWPLILIGLAFGSWVHLRLFIAIFSLFLLTFCFQFSEEALANHKFLNIWLVVANLFVAYGLWRLWHFRIKGWAIPSRLVAILLASPIFLGGFIDFFPIHNGTFIETGYTNDRLVKWVQSETKPDAVFVTDKFVNHPILLAGRRIWMGYTYFTWSAGYDLPKREVAYRQIFESKNAHQVFTLLKANKIDYVAFDVTVRGTFKNQNEQQVYVPNFKKVFEASDYWQLTIYKVPENADFVPTSPVAGPGGLPATGVSAFEGGKGKDNGQFDFPRGLTVDRVGNILVTDTNNGRIQRFSPTGAFLSVFGKPGQGPGEFREPGGLAVDGSGNIYVADYSNNRVQKLKPDGSFLAEWKGPEPGFFGPRDIAIGSDNLVYVVDQGHARIVKLDLNGKVIATWGGRGQEDGHFSEASGLAVDTKNNRVYVADPRNKRIEVFDTNGKFIAKWPVEQWVATGWYFQGLTVDSQAGRLYAASPTDEVLVFDLTGKRIASLKPKPPDKLEGASCLVLVKGKLYVLNTYGSRVGQIELEQK